MQVGGFDGLKSLLGPPNPAARLGVLRALQLTELKNLRPQLDWRVFRPFNYLSRVLKLSRWRVLGPFNHLSRVLKLSRLESFRVLKFETFSDHPLFDL
jgi:hypothetical protein